MRIHVLIKSAIICFIGVFFRCEYSFADTRNIHVIKILDTQSESIELAQSIKYFERGINQEANLIKETLGLNELYYHRIASTNFNKDYLEKRIESINITTDDIVVIFYAGHGMRDKTTSSDFPKLILSGYQLVDFLDIQDAILNKCPSVVVSIVVACNNELINEPKLKESPAFSAIVVSPEEYEERKTLGPPTPRSFVAYQRLFSKNDGGAKCIDFISSKVGLETLITDRGGYFFPQLLKAFDKNLSNPNTSWQQIKDEIIANTRKVTNSIQIPACNVYYRLFDIPSEKKKKKGFFKGIISMFTSNLCEKEVNKKRAELKQEWLSFRRKQKNEFKYFKTGRNLSKEDIQNLKSKQIIASLQMQQNHINYIRRERKKCRSSNR